MSYKRIKSFQGILNREDFNYISDEDNIEALKRILSRWSLIDEAEIKVIIAKINSYVRALDSFYRWTKSSIPEIREGCVKARTELLRIISLLEKNKERREKIKQQHLKKFFKNFLYGLSRILIGVKVMFDPDLVGSTTVTKEQIANYILDKEEGLGRRYRFNKLGPHNFVSTLSNLTMQEIIAVERLLKNPPRSQVRTANGWLDIGASRCPVRILIQPRKIGKSKAYFLFRKTVSGHRDYQQTMNNVNPEDVSFPTL